VFNYRAARASGFTATGPNLAIGTLSTSVLARELRPSTKNARKSPTSQSGVGPFVPYLSTET